MRDVCKKPKKTFIFIFKIANADSVEVTTNSF